MDESVSVDRQAVPHGADRWLAIHDDLLRGLTHALSNRAGTIAATAYLAEMQPQALVTSTATLRAEAERLDGVLQLLRMLPRRQEAAAEPIIPGDAITQAIGLQGYHPLVGDVPVRVALEGDPQPAYVDPVALVQALTAAIGAAQRAAGRDGHTTLRVDSDTEHVTFTAAGWNAGGTAGSADDACAYDAGAVNWLLASYAGSGVATASGLAVRVPTLQAARRRQRG